MDPDKVRDTDLLADTLRRRVDRHALLQTYRAMLNNLCKGFTESTQDYAARDPMMMSRTYPDIKMTETLNQLSIQHFMKGMPDPEISYEVIKLYPKTLEKVTDKYIWLEYCNLNTRRKISSMTLHTSNIIPTDDSEDEESDVRRMHGEQYDPVNNSTSTTVDAHDRMEAYNELQGQNVCYNIFSRYDNQPLQLPWQQIAFATNISSSCDNLRLQL